MPSLGGNSFFAARYGFVCDNVKNFEVSNIKVALLEDARG